MATLDAATPIQKTGPLTYEGSLHLDYSIGSVPNGGYIIAYFQRVALAHLPTQPHTLTLAINFPRRAEKGPASFQVKETKLGRRTSTIHIALLQVPEGKQKPEELAVSYLTQTDFSIEDGVTLPTSWTLQPPPPPLASSSLDEGLLKGTDPNWSSWTKPFQSARNAELRVKTWCPRNGQVAAGLADEWICSAQEGERWRTEDLGYIADTFPHLVESVYSPEQIKEALGGQFTGGEWDLPMWERSVSPFWYPTVTLSLEIKKALPKEGVKWLFSRTRAKKIQKGRADLEVVVMDEGGDLVAISNHVVLVVPGARNAGNRKTDGQKTVKSSKL